MRKFHLYFFISYLFFFFNSNHIFSQADTAKFKTVAAGKEYQASQWHQRLWGSNYRNVWTTPVTVKVLWLDTAKGGLKPASEGGGNQTKTLHFESASGKNYSIRSVNKTLGKVLPERFRGTFIEDLVNEEVSMSNPYAAATIPYLAEKAKVYHTNPTYMYVPKQPALDSFNVVYGDKLYLFEERIKGNMKDADNLGNFEGYIDTEELLDTLNKCSGCVVDEQQFIRSRLFDMFINDWDRHEKQWVWGIKKDGDKTVFVPVPKDRDQAYSTHNGFILSIAAGGLKYMQQFNDNLKDATAFNYEERNLDRRLLNQSTLTEWQTIATDLQTALTDDVIEKAMQQFPKEIYPLVGNNTIEILKARRTHIKEWATEYYNFISKEVEIPATSQDDKFEVQQLNDNETVVKVFDKNNAAPFYSRIFNASETKEIRLFGLKGENIYNISTNSNNNTKIKIISESNDDSITSSNKKNIIVYSDNDIKTNDETGIKNCNDTVNRSYNYNWYRYDKKGFVPLAFYSYEDRLFVSLGYNIKHYRWDKQPFASAQSFAVHYSLMENAFSFTYKALFPELVAKNDLSLYANYDAVRWKYFFGLGNDTKYPDDKTRKYFTTRTRQFLFQPALSKAFGKSTLSVFASLQGIKVINDTGRFISKVYISDNSLYKWKTFAGGGVSYTFQYLNDAVLPTKGIYFNAVGSGMQNINEKSSYNFNYSGTLHVYIPLVSKFSLGLRAGAATVTGNPEFYQYPAIGGPTLRGVVRDRFCGKTAFYNTNDLRFITPVHSKLYNGKIGLLALFDDGRVWMPNENSNTWHTAAGGGVIVVPFDFLYVDGTYGVSGNEHNITVRVTAYLGKR